MDFALEQDVEASIAKPRPHRGMRLEPLEHRDVDFAGPLLIAARRRAQRSPDRPAADWSRAS
jgi:hypothetical protein